MLQNLSVPRRKLFVQPDISSGKSGPRRVDRLSAEALAFVPRFSPRFGSTVHVHWRKDATSKEDSR